MAAWESAPLVDEAAPAAAPGRRPAYETAPAAITPGSALPNVAPPAAAPQAGLAPREVGFTETTGRTAGASAIPVARTLGLAAATIVGLIRGPEARDRVFAKTDEVVEGMRRMYEPQPGEQMSMPGQIVGGIAGAPIEVAGGFGLQRGVSKAADVLQRGGTGAEAAVAGGVTGAANVAANLLPVKVGGAVGGAIERQLGGKVLGGAAGGAATGGALGVAGNLGVVAAENASLPEGAQFQDLRTEAAPGVAGGLGAGLGAVAGALGARGVRVRGAPEASAAPVPEPGSKPSAGAAGTKTTTQRAERAAALPVPIELTKGQRERGFEQQRFERETAKQGEVGRPLRERFSEQNERVLKNFDEFVDQTGAGELDANAVGKSVTDPIVEKAMKAKDEIRAAYGKAEAAGETAELVPTDKIVESLSSMDSSKANAGVISAAESELVRLGGATRGADGNLIAGEISLADLEEVRKVIGKNGGKDDTNAHFAGELRAAIDASTDGRGGEIYKAARALHRDYAAEFKNQGVIRDLIGLKKGTSDRKVAIADVFDRSVLNASLEDLRNVKRTLTTAGEKGAQAWNDLRGKTIDWIKEQAAGNSARDERGNPIVSPAKLDRAIKKLDQDGRLDELFGKQGAQQLRDINDLAKDVYTTPPGAVNTSNTGSLLIHALDTMATYALSGGAIPLPAMAIVRKTIQGLKERKVKAKVRYALGPGEPVEGSPVRAFEPGKEPPVPPRGGKPPGAPPAPPAAGAAGAARGTKRERDLVGLREHATDPQVLKDLDAEIAAERRSAVEAKRAAEYRAIAEQTDDPGIKAKFTAKADKLAPPEPKAPEPEPIPVAEARELTDAEIDPVERVRIEAELETAWRREHRVGDMDAERAKAYARAEQLDPEAADRAVRQHENSPRAFDREIARIIEEGEARETQGKQDPGGGAGVADGAAASRGEAGGRAQPSGADGDAATGAQRGEAEAPGGSAALRDTARANKGASELARVIDEAAADPRARKDRAALYASEVKRLRDAADAAANPDIARHNRLMADMLDDRARGTRAPPTIPELFADNHGIARSDMPVITNDVKPEFRAELERAGIKVEAERVPASSLKATQRDYNAENIDYLRGKAQGKFDGNPIIVSRDGRVVDGHHRWAGAVIEGKPIDVLRVDLPIERVLELAKDFQQRKGIPSRSADDGAAVRYKLKPGEPLPPERERRVQEAVALAGDALPRAVIDDAVAILHQYKGPPPVDIPPKHKARLDEFIAPLIEKAKTVNGGFTKQVEDLAARLGAVAKTAPVKGAGRAVEKLYMDELESGLQAWPDSIGDLVRASIVVGDESQVAAAIKAVGEEFDIVKMKDRFAQPLETGYRDVLVSVRLPNGMRAELQIHVPEMIAAKELGHLLYEVQRVLPAGADSSALTAAQGRLYGAAYAAAGKRPGGGQPATSSSNLARPTSIKSSSDPSLRPVGTATYAPSENSTGSPSPFSKNRASDGIGGAFTDTILTGRPVGGGTIVTTERGIDVSVRYRLVDVGDLVTSHDDALRVNPAFPPEIQPRDRARDASEGQIARIENGIRPELLADSPKAGDGAPIIGSDAVVESGNARTIALRRAYASGKAEGYRTWLEQNAARFGLDPKDIAAIERPMLVRENTSTVDRAEFARQANESTVAGMSETEQAATDAKRLPDVEGLVTNDSGEILTRQSEEFIRQFMRYVASPNELNQLMTSDGRLSQRGVARIRNAVFARAYGDASIVAMLTESTEGNVRNLLAGMLRAAPDVARVRDLLDAGAREGADFAPDLVEAVRRYGLARESGQKVEQYLAQGSLISDDAASPKVAELMRQLERDARAPTRVADMIRGMVQEIDAGGDPRQAGLFVQEGAGPGYAPRLADDLAAQQEHLQRNAKAAGFDDIEDWVAADFGGFMRAAEEWRSRNPANELREPGAPLLRAQTVADLKAKTQREAAALKSDQAEQKRLADKARADAMGSDFMLTGSDRKADDPLQSSLFEKGAPYETDLFGNPAPPLRAERRPAAAAAGDVQPAAGVSGDIAPPAGRYATRAALVTTHRQKLGHVGRVRSLADSANALAYLRKSAVERLDGLVTDKNGTPLGVIGGFKGALSQASVYPATLLGEALQIPRAANIWLVHNHPSGSAALSQADEYLARSVGSAFDGTGIGVRGLVAVGSGGAWGGGGPDSQFAPTAQGSIAARDGGPAVAAQERQLSDAGTLGPAITSPSAAKDAVRELVRYNANRPTIVLLNSGHEPIAAVPWSGPDALPLLGNGKLALLLRAVAHSNAGAAIIGTGGGLAGQRAMSLQEAQNVGKALSKMDVRVLDIIDHDGASAAERGDTMMAPVLRAVAPVAAAGIGAGASAALSDDDEA